MFSRKVIMMTESNIRKKARRRGYSIHKYRRGWGHCYAATYWHSPVAEIWDATEAELHKFINSKPIDRKCPPKVGPQLRRAINQMKGGPR